MKMATSVFVLVALASSIAHAQVLRSLPGRFNSEQTVGQSVDSSGLVVGYAVSPLPMIWRPGGTTYTLEQLPFPAGYTRGAANSIGAGGAIAGYTQPGDLSTATATVWTAPPAAAYSPTLLPSPSGSTLTSAYSINATGSVGGFRETASGHTDAVVWDPIGPAYAAAILPGLADWVDTAATSINDNGDLVGYSFAALGGPRGAVWQKTPGGYVAKDVIAGADDVVITAINNFGTGAGVVNGDQAAVMVLFEDEYYAGELNVPFGSSDSAANAVNNNDYIVGYVKDPTTVQLGAEAAMWIPGDDEWELFNLDAWLNQVDPALGAQWVLEEATGISDNGLVTGSGVFDSTPTGGPAGVPRGFVLDVSSLVPEPASSAIVLLAVGPVLLRGRRRRRQRDAAAILSVPAGRGGRAPSAACTPPR